MPFHFLPKIKSLQSESSYSGVHKVSKQGSRSACYGNDIKCKSTSLEDYVWVLQFSDTHLLDPVPFGVVALTFSPAINPD